MTDSTHPTPTRPIASLEQRARMLLADCGLTFPTKRVLGYVIAAFRQQAEVDAGIAEAFARRCANTTTEIERVKPHLAELLKEATNAVVNGATEASRRIRAQFSGEKSDE